MTTEEKELLLKEVTEAVIEKIKDEYFLVRKNFYIEDQTKLDIIERVSFFVCQRLLIQPHELKTKTRRQEIVIARHIIFYLLRKLTNAALSFNDIGRPFDNDHATVLYASRKIEDRMQVDKNFRNKILTITAEFEEQNKQELQKFKI